MSQSSSISGYMDSSCSMEEIMSSEASETSEEEVRVVVASTVCNKQLTCGTHHKCMKPTNHADSCGAGNCPFVRMYERECGHKIVDKCSYEVPSNLPTCDKICGNKMKCSHYCERPCYACDGNCDHLDCDRCQWTIHSIMSRLNEDFSDDSDKIPSAEENEATVEHYDTDFSWTTSDS